MILGGPSCRCTFAHGRHELRGHGQLQGGHMQPVASRTPGGVVGCSFWLSSSLRTPVPACAASLALQVCAQPLAHALACALTLAFNVVPLPTTHRHPCHHACPLAPPTRMPCHRPGHPPFQATMANSRQGAPASRDCSRCGCAATGSTAPARTATGKLQPAAGRGAAAAAVCTCNNFTCAASHCFRACCVAFICCRATRASPPIPDTCAAARPCTAASSCPARCTHVAIFLLPARTPNDRASAPCSCGFAHGAEELQVPQARHPRGACLQWEHHGSCWVRMACREGGGAGRGGADRRGAARVGVWDCGERHALVWG